MITQLRKTLRMECAHHIPNHPGKCARPHGHSYVVEVFIRGEIDPKTGMIKDFYDIKADLEVIIGWCDHLDLNGCYSDMLTTAENLSVRWLTDLRKIDERYVGVRVHETESGCAESWSTGG
jgi:6-pyruvoyltetrahydropterin/6-carboxytetrahydropterin synthase